MSVLKDHEGKLSVGRILSIAAFLVATVYLFYAKYTSKTDIGSNDSMVVVWTFGIAIGGKAMSKFGEMRKK